MIILGTNSIKDTGYDVANSCRFNDGSSDTLTRTPSSASNRRTFTISFWVKRSSVDSAHKNVFSSGAYSSTQMTQVFFEATDELIFSDFTSSPSQNFNLTTNRKFRDPAAWMHIFIAVDTTQGTASNRIKIYVNGVQETSFATESYPSQNFDCAINVNQIHTIGNRNGASLFFDGYLSEFVFVDGTAQAHTDVGEFDSDSGIWKPINVSGLTFGTNGFYLDFEDSSALGNDANGSNNFTVNNLTAIDQSTDTCTNNFVTLNPLTNHSDLVLSEGNLKITASSVSAWRSQTSTFGVSAGKWYWEAKVGPVSTSNLHIFAICSENLISSEKAAVIISKLYSYGFKAYDGNKVYNEAAGGSSSSYGSAASENDILSVALDMTNLKIYFGINNTWQASGDPTSGATGTNAAFTIQSGQTYFPAVSMEGTSTLQWNFGAGSSYANSSDAADANGYGAFEYAPPSGYYSLCTKNLAEFG